MTSYEHIDAGSTSLLGGHVTGAARSYARAFSKEIAVVQKAIAIGQRHIATGRDNGEPRRSVSELMRQEQSLLRHVRGAKFARDIAAHGPPEAKEILRPFLTDAVSPSRQAAVSARVDRVRKHLEKNRRR